MRNNLTGKIVKKISGVFGLLLWSCFSYATHQVGGYISFQCLGGYTYQATITDYTNTYSTSADRDTMRIWWDDGSSSLLTRQNGYTGEELFGNGDGTPNGVPICNYRFDATPPIPLNGARKINIYQGVHTYVGPGSYRLWMDDPDRMAYIDNIAGSVGVVYYMYSTLIINPYVPNDGCVNSPLVTNPPVCQNGCVGQCYTYNPGAYIPNLSPNEDDSITYSIGNSLTISNSNPSQWQVAPGYYNEGATVDPITGTLTWCKPDTPGIYNFVILMTTLRRITVEGEKTIVPVDTTELELEVVIEGNCNPPVVTSKDTCVVAGGDVTIDYKATDDGHLLYITDAGEPFELSPPATLTNIASNFTVTPVFNWLTNCNEVRENPYEVVITATEKVLLGNGYNTDTAYYRGYGTSFITVIGPAPKNLTANVTGTTVCLHWDPSICPQATGYNIYRKIGCSTWKPGYCETGVPSYTGYTLIASNSGINDTTYCDSNRGAGLSPGVSYSYIVDATYPLPDGSQSYASNSVCALIKLGVPLITNVSVTKTDPAKGEMFIRWMKPLADTSDLDTINYPPPYKYILLHATGMNGLSFSTIATFTTSVFKNQLLDTTFTDTKLNTRDSSYNYKIDFYSGTKYVGSSGTASSIYLRLQSEDQSMNLGWSEAVPWTNDTFYIYRQDPPPALPVYNFLYKTTGSTYTDTGLHNGSQYCYYVKSSSHYGDTLIEHPLYDSSETSCGTPLDTIAPCSPPITITAKCVLYEDSIVWSNPNRLCPKANKVVSYEIFYSPTENGDMAPIATITNLEDTIYINGNLTSVAGCYAVIALDSAGQMSPFNTVCVDNCPLYSLPNVFTPNGDGENDFFVPIEPYRYVQSIDINIYNRWGQVLFHTTNPMIGWNGKVDNTGGPCPDGVYYYICIVNEIRLSGIVPVTLKGFIQLIR
jgi:gliding motility-associated-like protein